MTAHIDGQDGKRPFLVAPYFWIGDRFAPVAISICPHSIFDDRCCHVVAKDWRSRLFGPIHDLRVLGCKTHKIFFTVYPPGWGPLLRRPVIELAPDGSVIHGDGEDIPTNSSNQDDHGGLAPQVKEHLDYPPFRAAIDLAAGIQWPPDRETSYAYNIPEPPGVYRTQARHIVKVSRFFGLSDGLDDDYRLKTAMTLNVPTQEIIDGAVRARDGPGLKGVAAEISRLLGKTAPLQMTLKRILDQGARANFWGTPVIPQ